MGSAERYSLIRDGSQEVDVELHLRRKVVPQAVAAPQIAARRELDTDFEFWWDMFDFWSSSGRGCRLGPNVTTPITFDVEVGWGCSVARLNSPDSALRGFPASRLKVDECKPRAAHRAGEDGSGPATKPDLVRGATGCMR